MRSHKNRPPWAISNAVIPVSIEGPCATPNKRAYRTRKDAKLFLRQSRELPGEKKCAFTQLRVYLCPGTSHFHIGMQNPEGRDAARQIALRKTA